MNENLRAAIAQIEQEKALQDSLLKEKAAKDLFIFNKYILKAEDGPDKVSLSNFHKELCHFVTDNISKKKLILVPRGHLKSTLITVGYSLFRIANNPAVRILIQNATYQTAADFVRAIKRHLAENEDFKRIFGDLAKDPEEWSENRITLRQSKTGQKGKEPTVTGWGVETTKTGQHYDLIIHDDLVERENIGTRDQIEKVILRYKDSLDLLDPGGQMIVVGTKWTDGDLYSWIMDKDNHVISSYDVMLKKAFEWEGPIETALSTGEGLKSFLWPEKFDQKELLTRYREKGPYEFSTQYLNESVPAEDATFKKEWFHYYEPADVPGKLFYTYITVDPAISLEKQADYTGIVVTSIDQYGNIYIREVVRAKYKPTEIINELFKLAERWHPNRIGVEDVAYQKALAYSIREEAARRGRYLPIQEVKPGGRSKHQRIQALQPLYAAGKVFHWKQMPNNQYLEDELRRFPRGQHDDIIDALSYSLALLARPREKKEYFAGRYLY